MNVPVTVDVKPRSVLVRLPDGREIKLLKNRKSVVLQGTNRIGEKWGELSRKHSRTLWSCDALGIDRVSRLEAETAVWREAGMILEKSLFESRRDWHL